MRLSGAVRKTLFAIGGVVLCELLARVVAPGINDRVLGDYLRSGAPGALLKFYDLLVGGALARGAVLALGIMPFVSAWILVRIGEMVVPMRDRVSRRWTRGLTFGLAVVQSYGFARFVESIGAVDHPGTGFVARTMVLLTAGAMGVTWLAERFNAPSEPDRAPPPPLLQSSEPDVADVARRRAPIH